MTPRESLPPAYFDAVYAADDDPWQFESSAYEDAKYRTTVAALPRERYRRGLEIGCSIGVLTLRLAARCDELLAIDVNERALARAHQRCAHLAHVSFVRMQVPVQFPQGRFDLVVLSEVGYYWSNEDLAKAADIIVASLQPEASLLLVHWTEPVADYPLDGDAVHGHFQHQVDLGRLRHAHGERHARYRLDLFTRDAGRADPQGPSTNEGPENEHHDHPRSGGNA